MKCITCGSKMIEEVEKLYHDTAIGLSKVYLRNLPILKCTNPKCMEEEIVIPNPLQLHELLADQVASQTDKLSPEEIRFLRTHLGFSGVDFAKKMSVTPETVSRWEKGTINMSATVEKLLRVLILSKVGPFRFYDELDGFASGPHRNSHKRIFKLNKSKWVEDKVA